MRLLILSCSTGDGHNSAARAVAEEAVRRGITYEIADPVRFQGPRAQRLVTSCYNGMIRRTPKMFGAVYKLGALYDAAGWRSPVYWANSLYTDKLQKYITDNGVDAVVSTHLYGMEAMTALRRHTALRTPSVGVLTDYAVIPFFRETQLDSYCIPAASLAAPLKDRGIAEQRIAVTGIPVSARFSARLPQEEARRRLTLPQGVPVILVMCGGVGCGNVGGLCDALLARAPADARILVLTGRNEAMRRQLAERGDSRLTAVPFTTEVPLYMNASDALISKPGGLSSTDAATARIPLVHLSSIPGCESENLRFFASHGMSHAARSLQDAAEAALHLATHPEAAAAMREAQARSMPENAAALVLKEVEKQCASLR